MQNTVPSNTVASGRSGGLRRGWLEVETDLLLGVDAVLVPSSFSDTRAQVEPAPASQATVSSTSLRGRSFDADLFAPAQPRIETVKTRPPAPALSQDPSEASAPSQGAAVAVPLVDRVVPPPGASKSARLSELEAMHARECPHCTTASGHERIVYGEGNPDAEIVFVGEAPGETEDRVGRPFVGRAGEKLDEMISAMGLARSDVYIANVLKARPPGNRTPLAHEIDRCGPYLLAQLAIVRPRVVVTLGGPATKLLLASELGITRLRGVWATVRLGAAEGAPFEVPVMPTFHPAYLLRNYTPETRRQVWDDLKKVLDALGRPVPQRVRS